MSTTTVTETADRNPIARIMADRYDAGPIRSEPIVVEWAALHYAEQVGAAKAKKALRALNRRREEMGAMPCYVPYGSPLF